MSHTLPPWTSKYKMIKVFGNVDNNELAVRMKGLSLRDRRGDIVWWDDFECTNLKWFVTDTGGTGAAAISAAQAHFGDKSCEMITGANSGEDVYIEKELDLPSNSRLGFELYVFPTNPQMIFYMQPILYTGTRSLQAAVKWDVNNKKLYLNNSSGGWTEVADDVYHTLFYKHWLYLKLVIDWEAEKYVRLIYADTEYDASAISLEGNNSSALKRVWFLIFAESTQDLAKYVYVDNFIFTQNEP